MSVRIAGTDPWVTLDIAKFELASAQFAKLTGMTTQAQWDAFVAAWDGTNNSNIIKALLGCIKVSPTNPF